MDLGERRKRLRKRWHLFKARVMWNWRKFKNPDLWG